MSMTRFEIRNEYGLADSELYRAADKDDPEALLEGVAMAGLVGVLRQLGDLAEFAAEIFHNLYEEVMATAGRGHIIMIRVQQLEADFPSIERASLSQTDHSSCFYHAGFDWHPNLRLEMNLVTQGDLPRFVMDSYEECRGPPRLFLLDKFDVAGAGECLKRYTDPSFFKVETMDMTIGEAWREKKILELKKTGPRGRNRETIEAVQTSQSHAKLHQLFLEERTENGVNNHLRHVKLKKRLNGYSFDSKIGKSYMEKILNLHSPDHRVLHEVDVNLLSPLMPAKSNENYFGPEALEVRPLSPNRGFVGREISLNPSPDRSEIFLSPSIYYPTEVTTGDHIGMIPNSYHRFATGGISSSIDKRTAENVIAADAENNSEGCPTGFESYVSASEVENYVDAPSIMETEMETEDESGMKNDFTVPQIQSQSISDTNEEHYPNWILNSQSSGGSMMPDEGSNSSRKDISVCPSSESASTSAENPQSEKSANRSSPVDSPEIQIIATSSYQNSADEGFSVDQHSQTVVCDDTCITAEAINHHTSDFEQLSLCRDELVPTLVHSVSEGIVIENKSDQPQSDEISSTLDDDEKMKNVVTKQPCYLLVSDFALHFGDNSANLSAGQHLVNALKGERVLCTSAVPDFSCCITDSFATSLDLLHEDGACQEDAYGDDLNLVENTASASNMFNALSQSRYYAPKMKPTTNPIIGESDDEVPKFLENSSSDYPDTAHNEDVIQSVVSPEDNLPSKFDNEDSNTSIDAPHYSSDTMEASFGQKLNEKLLVNAQTVDADENRSNISTENLCSSENLVKLHSANSSDWLQAGPDADEEDVIPQQESMGNGTFALESPPCCGVVRLQATGMTGCVFPCDSEALESSFHTIENLEEEAGTSDTVKMDGMTLSMTSTVREVALDEPDSEGEKSNSDMVSNVCIVSHNTSLDSTHSNEDFNKVVEDVHRFDNSSLDELEEVGQTEAAVSDSEVVLCNSINHDISKLEVSDTVPNSHLDLEVDNRWKFVDAATIHPLLVQSDLGTEHETVRQSSHGNDGPDAKSFPIDHGTDESTKSEDIELPSNKFDLELSQPGNISRDLSTLLPTTAQLMLGHDNHKRDDVSAPTFSLIHCLTPPSISEPQNQSNYDDGVPGYPQYPLSSIFPPNNPFTESNKIILANLPPLPPLPPVQWRMGKFQQDSASTRGGVIEHQDLSPQAVAPMTGSMDGVASSLVNTSVGDCKTFPPTVSAYGVGTSLQTASSTDDVNSSSLTPSIDYVDLVFEEGTHCPTQTAPKVESKEEEAHCPIQTAPKAESKEEEAKDSCSTLEFKHMSETIDVVPNIENKQQQSVMPTPNSEMTSPEEYGLSHGSHMVKMPHPRKPLVEDAVVLDKSKLRKVTERDRPQIQEDDEKDAFLEQIRNKSFNLKPIMASRPSIQHPRTNLRVAAILEKANAIRQVLADSDEDDDDRWSDS